MISLQFSLELPKIEIPNGVMVPNMITRIINMGPDPLQTQGLAPTSTPNGEMMWMHPQPC